MRQISLDEAINEIKEVLCEADGVFIEDIYNRVTGKDADYQGDSLIIINDKID